MTEVGLKIGSLNTVTAIRNGSGIKTQFDRTIIRYPFDKILNKPLPPIVGEEASKHNDAKRPLNLGVIDEDDGISQTKDILSKFIIPPESNMVVAAPAVEVRDGRSRLLQVINDVYNPKSEWLVSEGLCSAVYVLKDPSIILDSTFLSLNLGSTTTEFGCFSESEAVHLSAHGDMSGEIVDRHILNLVNSSVGNTVLTLKEARDIKESASLLEQKSFSVSGKTQYGIVEKQISEEVTTPIRQYVEKVAEFTRQEILNNIPNSTLSMIFRQHLPSGEPMPFIVSGGMSNIEGLPELLVSTISKKLNHTFIVDYPKNNQGHLAPAIGGLLLCEQMMKDELP